MLVDRFKHLLNKIPAELVNEPRWAWSDENKVPTDPKLWYFGAQQGLSKISHLVTLPQLLTIEPLNELWQPAYKLHAKDNNIMVIDIEPTGINEPTNPYIDFIYDYAEESRHGGLHGILKMDKSRNALMTKKSDDKFFWQEKVVYHGDKNTKFDTEILMNSHFVTFTGKPVNPEIYIKKSNYHPMIDYLNKIQTDTQTQHTDNDSSIQIQSIDKFFDKSLHPIAKKELEKLQKVNQWFNPKHQPFKPGTDTSQVEYKRLNSVWWDVMHSESRRTIRELDLIDRIQLATKIASEIWPTRKKHQRMATDNRHGDRVPYIVRISRQIVERDDHSYKEWLQKQKKEKQRSYING